MDNNCVAYLRYSSENQTENSIEYQRKLIEGYCSAHNLVLMKEFIDRAKNGTTDQREGLQKLIQEASKKPKWTKVLFYDHSRFFRNVQMALEYKNELESNGIELVSIQRPHVNKTPESDLMDYIELACAEYYSKKLSVNTHDGLKNKASSAGHCGGKPPLGYDLDANQKLIINDDEAQIVREIFRLYLNNYSYQKMADILNQKGYRTKNGQNFRKNSFSSILTQRKYIGEFCWNRASPKYNGIRNNHKSKPIEEQIVIKDGCPKIITLEDFEKVQEKMKSNACGRAGSKAKHYYMLGGNGFLKCGECGKSMTGTIRKSHGKTYYTYLCPEHKAKHCETKEIRAEKLNLIIAQQLSELIFNENNLKDFNRLINLSLKDDSENQKRLKDKIKGIGKKIDNIIKSIENEPSSIMVRRINELNAEKEDLESKLAKFITNPVKVTIKELKEMKSKFIELVTNQDLPEVRDFLKNVIQEIIIDNETVNVTFNFNTIRNDE